MNKYPYTNYQDLNLDWVLGVAAEMRACFEPVEVSGTNSYKELVRRGALATIKYADATYTDGLSIILPVSRIDESSQKLYFTGTYHNGTRFVAVSVTVDYYGNIAATRKLL